MNNFLLIITASVIVLGIIVGGLIVGLIYLQQQRKVVDSLIRLDNLVGCFAMVEVPFNQNSRGKIRVNIKGSLVDFVACTDEIHQFNQGDFVVIVRIERNKAWVVGV